jgi:hypothetical protein
MPSRRYAASSLGSRRGWEKISLDKPQNFDRGKFLYGFHLRRMRGIEVGQVQAMADTKLNLPLLVGS